MFAPALVFWEPTFLIMLLETAGATMIAIGLLARPVALFIVFQMIGISYTLGLTWPWFDRALNTRTNGVSSMYIAVRGSGAYSADYKSSFRSKFERT